MFCHGCAISVGGDVNYCVNCMQDKLFMLFKVKLDKFSIRNNTCSVQKIMKRHMI